MTTTTTPVTLNGWYELTDGTVQHFVWQHGHVKGGEVVASWADVPSEEDRLSDVGSRAFRIGDRLQTGDQMSDEAADTGRVLAVGADGILIVGWDSGVVTPCNASTLVKVAS